MAKRKPDRPIRNVPVTDARSGGARTVSAMEQRPSDSDAFRAAERVTMGDAAAGMADPKPREGRLDEGAEVGISTAIAPTLDTVQPGAVGVGEVQDVDKSDRPEPVQNLAEFISAIYAGRLKSLSGAVLNRIKASSSMMDALTRAALLADTLRVDPSLEKAKLLMLLARKAGPNRAIARAIREFVRDAVKQHPVMHGEPTHAGAFPGSSDSSAPEKVWHALVRTEIPLKLRRQPRRGDDSADEGTDGEGVSQDANSESVGQTARLNAQFSKARRNAFLCDVLWRFDEDLAGFTDSLRTLRQTVFAADERPARVEQGLIEALATVSEKDDDRIALLLDWEWQSVLALRTKLAELERRDAELRRQLSDEQNRIADARRAYRAQLAETETHKAAVQSAKTEFDNYRIHARADFEHLRAASLGVIRHAIDELGNVDVALSREQPKVSFTRDVIHTVMDSLVRHVKSLEDEK